jgi:Ca-activated chloride channel family protein
VVELELAGSALREHAPRRLPDLLAAAPARIALALRPAGGELIVRGRGLIGTWEQRLRVAPIQVASGRPELVSLLGREQVEDLECELAAGGEREAIDAEVEALGLAYGLATRRTSWVAVSTEQDVDPTAPTRRERIPHELAQGLSVEGLGLRAPSSSQCLSFLASADVEEATLGLDSRAMAPMRSLEPADFALGQPRFSLPRRRTRRRRLKGRVVALGDGRLSIELLSDGVDWELPDELVVTWADGSRVAVVVDAGASTGPGRIEAGATLRLVVRLPDEAPAGLPARLVLELDGEQVEVQLC